MKYDVYLQLTGAIVSLEQTRYRVDGGVSEIKVCARVSSPSISCPIQFPFVIGLATDHQSAGLCIHAQWMLATLKPVIFVTHLAILVSCFFTNITSRKQ